MFGTKSSGAVRLSRRQREVLRLVAEGKTNAEIADALGISLDGAKWHVSALLEKLDVATRKDAAAYSARSQNGKSALAPLLLRWVFLGGAAGLAGLGTLFAVLIVTNHLASTSSSSSVRAAEAVSTEPVTEALVEAVGCLRDRGISAWVDAPMSSASFPVVALDDTGHSRDVVDTATRECWEEFVSPMEIQTLRMSGPDESTRADARRFVAACVVSQGGTVTTLTPGDVDISEWMDSPDPLTRIAMGHCIQERHEVYGF